MDQEIPTVETLITLQGDSKMKKNDSKEESYEVKYKRLVSFLNNQNLGSKFLLVEEEEWVEEEESSDRGVRLNGSV